jgi:hypothetical protein
MNISIDEAKALIKEARDNNTVAVVRGLFDNTPQWEDFIGMLDFKYNSIEQQNQTQEPHNRFITKNSKIIDILVFNDLDMHVFHVVDYKPNLYKNIIPWLKEVFEIHHLGTKALINFVGNEGDYGIHSDEHDVVLWGCAGSVDWNIYDDKNNINSYVTYTINPGDILFCPKGVTHQAIVTKPRASMVFAFNFPDTK